MFLIYLSLFPLQYTIFEYIIYLSIFNVSHISEPISIWRILISFGERIYGGSPPAENPRGFLHEPFVLVVRTALDVLACEWLVCAGQAHGYKSRLILDL